MNLQNISLQMNNNINTGRFIGNDNTRTDHARNDKKSNNQSLTVVSLSADSQFEKMIENIREQIQKVSENDRYDADTKKSKIEELENQLKEIEKIKTEQINESLLDTRKKPEKNKTGNSGNNTENFEENGVMLDLSIDAKALIEADNSLKSLKEANSMRVNLKGSANILETEIKIDKGRGVDTTRKEKQLAGMKNGIEKSFENIGEAIKDASKATKEMSESAEAQFVKKDESGEDKSDNSEKISADEPNPNLETI